MESKISQTMSDKKIGEILKVSRVKLCVDWKIPNFLSLPHKKSDYFESPLFHFRGATWYVTIYPRGEDDDFGSRFITAFLHKEWPDTKKHGIQYRIGIRKKDGSEYDTKFEDYQSDSKDDESEAEGNESKSEGNESKSEDDESESEGDESAHEDDQSSRRVVKLVKKSMLCANSTELLPQGVLTVFCILRASKTGNKEAGTDTEISVGTDKLAKDFKNLLIGEKDSDVIIKVKNKEFRAHRSVLRTRSSVFDSMFNHDMAEKNCGIVDIPDCDPRAFQYFLTYLYSASIDNLSDDIVFNLYFIADKYDTEELKNKCMEFMASNLSVDTFCNVVSLALQHAESDLLQTTRDFFINNTKEVIMSVHWQSFLRENPVMANELYIKSFDYNIIQK